MSSTDKAASADEQPKKAIAKKVVKPKRRYFVPHLGRSVEGAFALPQEAADKLENKLKKEKKASNG